MDKPLIKCIAFDYDGTIVDSNGAKDLAYIEACNDCNIPEKVFNSVKAKFPTETRFKIISEVLNDLNRSEEFDEVVSHVTKTIEKKVIESSLIPGIEDVLKPLQNKIPLYINSATPQESLRNVVNGKDLSKYFKGVYGKPKTKEENLEFIMRRENIVPNELLMIGDNQNDLASALHHKCHFLGIIYDKSSTILDEDILKRDDYSDFFDLFSF